MSGIHLDGYVSGGLGARFPLGESESSQQGSGDLSAGGLVASEDFEVFASLGPFANLALGGNGTDGQMGGRLSIGGVVYPPFVFAALTGSLGYDLRRDAPSLDAALSVMLPMSTHRRFPAFALGLEAGLTNIGNLGDAEGADSFVESLSVGLRALMLIPGS